MGGGASGARFGAEVLATLSTEPLKDFLRTLVLHGGAKNPRPFPRKRRALSVDRRYWARKSAKLELSFLTVPPANALGLDEAWSHSYTPTGETHPASVAVRLRLSNPGTEPWTLAGAALVDSAGEQVELARWPLAPIPANGAGAVVVGIKGERAQLGCPCTLKLWEAQGPRTFTLEDVTFPEGKAKGP